MAEQPPKGTPPIETSPEFQERTKNALGGSPTHPSQFQEIGAGATNTPQPSGGIATASPQPFSVFDEDPQEAQHRMKLNHLRQALGKSVKELRDFIDKLSPLLQELANDEAFLKFAKSQGFDVKKAQGFVESSDKAVSSVTK